MGIRQWHFSVLNRRSFRLPEAAITVRRYASTHVSRAMAFFHPPARCARLRHAIQLSVSIRGNPFPTRRRPDAPSCHS